MTEGKLKSTGFNRNKKIEQELQWKGKKQEIRETLLTSLLPLDVHMTNFSWVNLFSVSIQHISIALWSFTPLKLNFKRAKVVYNDILLLQLQPLSTVCFTMQAHSLSYLILTITLRFYWSLCRLNNLPKIH